MPFAYVLRNLLVNFRQLFLVATSSLSLYNPGCPEKGRTDSKAMPGLPRWEVLRAAGHGSEVLGPLPSCLGLGAEEAAY